MDFIEKHNQLAADYLIFDLEDAVSEKEQEQAFENISKLEKAENYYVRVPLKKAGCYDFRLIERLILSGFLRFLLPKIECMDYIQALSTFLRGQSVDYKSLHFILLIESAKGLLAIEEILICNEIMVVDAIAFGSHDYCVDMGIVHTMKGIEWARNFLLHVAKANDIKAIDFTSMELNNMERFKSEVEDGLVRGFNGKGIIHPCQLAEINAIEDFSKEEIVEAFNIYNLLEGNLNDINAMRYKGRVLEKPHMYRIKNIINRYYRNGE